MKNKIKDWTNLTDEITEQWIREYFEIEDGEHIYFDWVEVGGVFNYGDYFINFSTVLECYKLNVSVENLFLWYDKTVELQTDLSLSDFILSPKKLKEKEEKYLQELKERVNFAEEEFNKALENYK